MFEKSFSFGVCLDKLNLNWTEFSFFWLINSYLLIGVIVQTCINFLLHNRSLHNSLLVNK